MNYPEYCKANGIKLELQRVSGREAWKKYFGGKHHRYVHPLTKAGYEKAHAEMMLDMAKLNGNRPNIAAYNHHITLFSDVAKYFTLMGVSPAEKRLSAQVTKFVELVTELMEETKLAPIVNVAEWVVANPEFKSEFVGRGNIIGMGDYKLPDKWLDRIQRIEPVKATKEPQTIQHWLNKYMTSTTARVGKSITKGSADVLPHKLANYRKYADLSLHVSTIDNDYLTKYHDHVSESTIATTTKVSYFANFKMFLRWMIRQQSCEFKILPTNMDSPEHGFREASGKGRKRMEKKKLLWSKADFDAAMELPAPYPCFVLMFLNCGFRHADVGNLQKDDVDLKKGRIIIQRNKLNQLDSIPVINYKLWPQTIEKMKEAMSDDEVYFFRNTKGGSVQKAIKEWWKRNGVEKRLDYLRKTGATITSEYSNGIEEMYLGEALSTTARINYKFKDGEVNDTLDYAIQHLGSKFGLCKPPEMAVVLTPDMIEALREKGFAI